MWLFIKNLAHIQLRFQDKLIDQLSVLFGSLLSLLCFLQNRGNHHRRLEMETWHDLANVYTSLSQWRDAEVCLSKSKAIGCHSASRWHSTGTQSETSIYPLHVILMKIVW